MKRSLIILMTVLSFLFAAVIGIVVLVSASRMYAEPVKVEGSDSETNSVTDTLANEVTNGVTPDTVPVVDRVTETTTVTTPATTPATTTAATPSPTVTPVDGNPGNDSRAPLLLPPETSGKPCTFYNDAAFIGDSVSVMLTWYAERTGVLGTPLFLTKECYGMVHAKNGTMLFNVNGKELSPEDALAEAGVKKVFIMLGMNDIGYSHEYIMNNWRTVIGRIREKSPGIKIYIQSCTPIWTGGEKNVINNENMDSFNLKLKALAAELNCTFVDVAPYFKDSTGGLATVYCSDNYVHLSNEGVATWSKFLIAYAEAAS